MWTLMILAALLSNAVPVKKENCGMKWTDINGKTIPPQPEALNPMDCRTVVKWGIVWK